jgi:putative OPT family oligopeptide transporter
MCLHSKPKKYSIEGRKMTQISHKPYISAEKIIPEFTLKAILLGILFGLIFGATTSYLALKVGLTVSASIPIAVLAISLFKKFENSTILENNIVQTIGSAGESVAAGVAFTLPAFLFLSVGAEYFNYLQIFILALIGGILGVFYMIPLRKTLIVQEHGRLPYPEGTACADILVAGERGGDLAKKVYYGIGVAFIYKFFMSILGLWKEIPEYVFNRKSAFPNGSISAEITPELLGVGYIIGIRYSGIMVAGGILSAWVLTPLITAIGDHLTIVVPPATKLISEMSPMEIWSKYIRYIGAGAVTFAGIITMIRTIPTIIKTFKTVFKDIRGKKESLDGTRVDQDIPLSYVLLGVVILFFAMVFLPGVPVTPYSALIILIASFIFVTISSRIVGIIGSSSNPVSGMTIATLMGTSLIFIAQGWVQDVYQPIALCVGGIVAIAVASSGAISQDLKTGFLIGATPSKQQWGMIIGVITSACAIGLTITLLHATIGFGDITVEHQHPLPAPQAMLMSTIIKGIFDQSLPWSLVIIGMGIAAVVELCGINSLAFAVGTYLPLSTGVPIFVGGLIKWFVRKQKTIKAEEADLETGALFSSGLIAGGALTGILIACMLGITISNQEGNPSTLLDMVSLHLGERIGAASDLIAVGCFVILCCLLYGSATKKNPKEN